MNWQIVLYNSGFFNFMLNLIMMFSCSGYIMFVKPMEYLWREWILCQVVLRVVLWRAMPTVHFSVYQLTTKSKCTKSCPEVRRKRDNITMSSRYNMANSCPKCSPLHRHPIAYPHGWVMGCLLWVLSDLCLTFVSVVLHTMSWDIGLCCYETWLRFLQQL